MKKEFGSSVSRMGLVLAAVTAVAEGTNDPSGGGTHGNKSQKRDQDRLRPAARTLTRSAPVCMSLCLVLCSKRYRT